MNEILARLPARAWVLDLGCCTGSFPDSATAATAVRVDLEGRGTGGLYLRADAARLPFGDECFDAVVLNHSLEHFDDLDGALREIGRVVARDGFVFVAVPDASTVTDRLYRWLARGGGHVNSFTSAAETGRMIESAIGLPVAATRVLCSSLSFLNRRNAPQPGPRRLWLLGGGSEWSLFLYGWVSRRVDRWFGWRTSVYGWAFYFGTFPEAVDTKTRANVCLPCGGGAAADWLVREGLVRFVLGTRVWRCGGCGALNPFAEE